MRQSTKIRTQHQGLQMLFYRAALPLSSRTLNYAAGIIRRHRKAIGSCWRKLNPGRQALLVLAYLRKGETFAELAAGFGVGTTTAWRYVNETAELLAARAPKLRQAVRDAVRAGYAYVVVDGTLIPVDRVAADRPFYSGTVICTSPTSLIIAPVYRPGVVKEAVVDLRRQLMEGRTAIPRVGSVAQVARTQLPFVVLDDNGAEVEPVSQYLRELVLGDCSPLTCRSYAQGLLRWFRLLWVLDVGWERATESDVAVMVAWLRTAPNPQRERSAVSPAAGSVNLVTGKPALGPGYSKRTINHALSVVSGFYEYHGHYGRGPVVNPVPSSAERRRALSHLSPLEPKPVVGRARLRQKVPARPPRAIPDERWDELFAAMGCERDRALLEFSVSSGARAAELLGVWPEDVDWAGRQVYVISKGTRRREPVPASPQAFIHLAHYLDECGPRRLGEPVWRARRGPDRPLSYWALRRVLQRADDLLGANWSWHDMRHTACARMASSPELTLPEVQAIMRHASIQTTSRYLAVRVEEIFDKLTQHYNLPRPDTHYPAGYAADDITAVFGAGGAR